MKKIMNTPETIEDDFFRGIAHLYSKTLRRIPDTGIFVSKEKSKGVAIISGGGSGHEPADIGYVGEGFLQACVMGKVFIPPNAKDVVTAIVEADSGSGVFVVIKNFKEDVKEFLEGIDQAKEKGHQVAYVIVNDDCSVEDEGYKKRRRGVAGTVLVMKILGAAAHEGLNLNELKNLAESLVSSTNTLGVALSSATLPGQEKPLFDLPPDKISYGVGIHGEIGYRQEKDLDSVYLALEIWNKLKSQGDLKPHDSIALLINGMGGTPLMELMVFYNDLSQLVKLDDINIDFIKIGDFMTTLDMKGVSVSCMKLKEPQWKVWLDKDAKGFAWNL